MKVADETVSTFNAGASMLGYLYQVRVALLWAIRQRCGCHQRTTLQAELYHVSLRGPAQLRG